MGISKNQLVNAITKMKNFTQNFVKSELNISGSFVSEEGFGKLRWYNGHFQYYDTDTSTWVDTTVTPDNVYVMNMMPQPMKRIVGIYDINIGKFKLKWEEPNDTIVDNQVLCIVDKVIIRRKLGSAPIDENDGDLVIEIKRKDFGKYKSSYFVDNEITPEFGDVYYYKAFPVSTVGFYNVSTINEINILCKDYILYGFKIDQNESDPDSMITYIEDNANFSSAKMDYENNTFDYGDWGDVWFIKNLKPCMLKYDGTVDYELDKNDYTKKLDGSDSDVANTSYEGNAMVGVPKVYWKIVDNGDGTVNVYFSDKKVDDDFYCWSHIDNNGNEIDYCYMPIYIGTVVSDKIRSLKGNLPTHSNTLQNEIAYSKANNLEDSSIWYTEVFCDRMLITLLLLLIGKSTDSQTIFGTGNNNSYSSDSNTGIKVAGSMDTKGLFWGSQDNKSGVKVFGIEHFWGNQWRRIAGLILDNGTYKVKLTYGQQDGSTIDGYNIDGDGYVSIEGTVIAGTSGGYINKMCFNKFGMIPNEANGSSTTYYPDSLFFNNSQVCYLVIGGATWTRLAASGVFVYDLNGGTDARKYITASISCKPLAIIE